MNRKFEELNRDYHTNDGDKYVTTWNKKFEDIEPITTIHRYKNKVKHSDSIIPFSRNEQKLPVLEYMKLDGYFCNFIYGYNDGKAQMLLRQWNAWLGAKKKVVMMIMVFENQPYQIALEQEAYWRGGNKNEFIVCIGTKNGAIEWARVISWTPQTVLKVQLAREIKEMEPFNILRIVNYVGATVEETSGYIRRDMEEYDYLTVPVPTVATVLAFMLSFVLSGSLLVWSVKNEFEVV